MQDDKINHHFQNGSFFEDVVDLYNFDRHFRIIVFNAIERIEVALRAKLIYHLSLGYSPEWYLRPELFEIDSCLGLTATGKRFFKILIQFRHHFAYLFQAVVELLVGWAFRQPIRILGEDLSHYRVYGYGNPARCFLLRNLDEAVINLGNGLLGLS